MNWKKIKSESLAHDKTQENKKKIALETKI